MDILLSVSSTDLVVGKHPINDIRNGDAIANGLYIFDRVLAEQTLKDASDKVDHDPISLLSQHGGQPRKLEHPFLVDY